MTPVLQMIFALAGLALVGIAGIAILNALTFPRLRPAIPPAPPPKLSVLIPARNEAAVIGTTIRTLVAQTYANLEILVLDDHSDDGTGQIALAAAAGDPRLCVLKGADLPAGWLGKNWACQQLGKAAAGDWLIFTDADVTWQPDALAALMSAADATRADLFTVWSTQITETWGERLVVPLMALVVMGYLPALLVSETRFASLAAACGQCLAFRRTAYEQIGGHQIVRASIIEDIALGRAVKRAGLRLVEADGAGLILCRMYRGWAGVRAGYAKNIIAGYGGVVGVLLATLFHWAVFLLPPFALTAGLLGGDVALTAWGAGLSALGMLVRALTAASTRQRVWDALLMPLSALAMTFIVGQALVWRVRYGGPQWKGRVIKTGGV